MLRQGPISLAMHAAAEPFLAALLVAAPFLFGFHDRSAPTAACIVLGILVLLVAMSTKWRLSLVKVIPVPVHMLIDLATGAFLIAAPFLLGFDDHTGATTFFIVLGVLELLAVLATRWRSEHAGERHGRRRGRRGSAPAAG